MTLRVAQGDSHAVIVPVGAVGVLVEGLRRDAGVHQAGQQPREVVCGVLLAEVPAATPFIGTRLCDGSSHEMRIWAPTLPRYLCSEHSMSAKLSSVTCAEPDLGLPARELADLPATPATTSFIGTRIR